MADALDSIQAAYVASPVKASQLDEDLCNITKPQQDSIYDMSSFLSPGRKRGLHGGQPHQV